MQDFISEILSPVNLPATLLLAMVVVYWILVLLGALGADALDFDPNVDVDVDVNVDLEGGVDVDVAQGLSQTVYSFFYLGDIPVMIIGSIFALLFWILTVVSNHYLNPEFSWWVTAVLFLPCVGISLLLTKLILMPAAPLFRSQTSENDRRAYLIGRSAVVNTNDLTDKFGEVRIEQQGPPLVLNARNEKGQRLKKGDVVKIVGYDRDKDICIVELPKPEKS